MTSKKYFITGVPGTGKSTLGGVLKEQGYSVFDVDELGNLCGWMNTKTGEKVAITEINDEFLAGHDYCCDMEQLDKMIADVSGTVFMIGCIGDNSAFLPRFDKTFLLQCSSQVLMNRLTHRTNNPFGKSDETQAIIIDWRNTFDKLMLEKGAIPIHSEQSVEEVAKDLMEFIK